MTKKVKKYIKLCNKFHNLLPQDGELADLLLEEIDNLWTSFSKKEKKIVQDLYG